MDACGAEVVAMMADDPFAAKCLPTYSEADKAKFQNYVQLAAGVKCFLENFHDACSTYVYNSMMAAAEQANAGNQALGK